MQSYKYLTMFFFFLALLMNLNSAEAQADINKLKQCISVLFAFQRRPISDTEFVELSRSWLQRMVSEYVNNVHIIKVSLTQQLLFIIPVDNWLTFIAYGILSDTIWIIPTVLNPKLNEVTGFHYFTLDEEVDTGCYIISRLTPPHSQLD